MVFIWMKRNAEDAEEEEEDAEGLLGKIDDVAFDAVAEKDHVEIDEQAQTLVGQTHVGVKLGFVDWNDYRDGFDFNNDAFIDQKIDSISLFVQVLSFVENLGRNLTP